MTPSQAKELLDNLDKIGFNSYKIHKATGLALITLRKIKKGQVGHIRKETERKLKEFLIYIDIGSIIKARNEQY